MPVDPYKYSGPIDTTVSPDLSTLKGKSVIVTGGVYSLSYPAFKQILTCNRCQWSRRSIRSSILGSWVRRYEIFPGGRCTEASTRAYVTFGDINEEKGASMEKELAP